MDWANLSGQYKRSDRNDWLALCRSCHMKMDMTDATRQKMSASKKGKMPHPVTENMRIASSKTGTLLAKTLPRNNKGQFQKKLK